MKNITFKVLLISLLSLCSLFFVSCTNNNASHDYNLGYDDGYEDGYDDGENDGYISGYEYGKNDGIEQGKIEGRNEYYNEGYNAGYQKALEELYAGKIFSIHTDAQMSYIDSKVNALSYNNKSIGGLEELSKPQEIVITIPSSPLYPEANSYSVYFSEDENFLTYKLIETTTNSFSVKNLKINTPYYWYSIAHTDSGVFTSSINTIYTRNESIRNLDIDGVTNARDCGGWLINETGKYTAQGLILRTGRLHTNGTNQITKEGINTLKNDFKLKTEIDLRYSTDGNSYYQSVVPNVTYYTIPMDWHISLYNETINKSATKEVFKIFAADASYPILFHCSIGTDRTGYIAFLLNGLLGVSEDNLYKDYLFSNFGLINSARTNSAITEYITFIKDNYCTKTNKSLQYGIRQFLLSLGLTNTELDNIVNIMTGKKNPLAHIASNTWEELDNNYHVQRCTDCGEIVSKQGHTFDTCTKIDESTHSTTCTLCSKTITQNHKYIFGVCSCGAIEPSFGPINHLQTEAITSVDLTTLTSSPLPTTDYVVLEYSIKMKYFNVLTNTDPSRFREVYCQLNLANSKTISYSFGWQNNNREMVYFKRYNESISYSDQNSYDKLMQLYDDTADTLISVNKYLDSNQYMNIDVRLIIDNKNNTVTQWYRILENTGKYTNWMQEGNNVVYRGENEEVLSHASTISSITFTSSISNIEYHINNIRLYSGTDAVNRNSIPDIIK